MIVGGSHSAFSAAWMCLHKLDLSVKEDSTLIPTPIATATLTATTATATLTTAVTATVTATTTATVTATPSETESEKASAHTDIGIDTDTGIDTHCCGSPLRTAASSPSKPPKSPSYQSLNQETTDEMSNVIVAATSPSKSSVCKIKEREKMKQKLFTKSDSISTKGMTGQSDVLILHRSYIKVFYSTKREADYDLYYDTGVINKSTGQIHPFGGLRGDSKSLWR